MARVLIIGQGNLGYSLAQQLASTHQVTAVRRTLPYTDNTTFTTLSRDITQPFELNTDVVDYVFFIVSPQGRENADYQATYVNGLTNTLAALRSIRKRLFIISSTRVYGDAPQMQDEHAPITIKDDKAALLREMEVLGETSGYPCTVIRFSGLYRGDSQRLRSVVCEIAQGQRDWPEARYSNRFHYGDAVQLLVNLCAHAESGLDCQTLYIGTDNDCVTNHTLFQFFAEQEQLALPPKPASTVIHGKQLRSRYLSSVITLRYPSYTIGYAQVSHQ